MSTPNSGPSVIFNALLALKRMVHTKRPFSNFAIRTAARSTCARGFAEPSTLHHHLCVTPPDCRAVSSMCDCRRRTLGPESDRIQEECANRTQDREREVRGQGTADGKYRQTEHRRDVRATCTSTTAAQQLRRNSNFAKR